jgi:hypothetical protein
MRPHVPRWPGPPLCNSIYKSVSTHQPPTHARWPKPTPAWVVPPRLHPHHRTVLLSVLSAATRQPRTPPMFLSNLSPQVQSPDRVSKALLVPCISASAELGNRVSGPRARSGNLIRPCQQVQLHHPDTHLHTTIYRYNRASAPPTGMNRHLHHFILRKSFCLLGSRATQCWVSCRSTTGASLLAW